MTMGVNPYPEFQPENVRAVKMRHVEGDSIGRSNNLLPRTSCGDWTLWGDM